MKTFQSIVPAFGLFALASAWSNDTAVAYTTTTEVVATYTTFCPSATTFVAPNSKTYTVTEVSSSSPRHPVLVTAPVAISLQAILPCYSSWFAYELRPAGLASLHTSFAAISYHNILQLSFELIASPLGHDPHDHRLLMHHLQDLGRCC